MNTLDLMYLYIHPQKFDFFFFKFFYVFTKLVFLILKSKLFSRTNIVFYWYNEICHSKINVLFYFQLLFHQNGDVYFCCFGQQNALKSIHW